MGAGKKETEKKVAGREKREGGERNGGEWGTGNRIGQSRGSDVFGEIGLRESEKREAKGL